MTQTKLPPANPARFSLSAAVTMVENVRTSATGAAEGTGERKSLGRQGRRVRVGALNGFPDVFPETACLPLPVRTKSKPLPRSAVAEHRGRLRSRGLQRLEVMVRGEDAFLASAVAAALADPEQAAEARSG